MNYKRQLLTYMITVTFCDSPKKNNLNLLLFISIKYFFKIALASASLLDGIGNQEMNKLAKLRRHASRVSFGSKKFEPN